MYRAYVNVLLIFDNVGLTSSVYVIRSGKEHLKGRMAFEASN